METGMVDVDLFILQLTTYTAISSSLECCSIVRNLSGQCSVSSFPCLKSLILRADMIGVSRC